jgi:hypothetical protein
MDRAAFLGWTLVAALTTCPIAGSACPTARNALAAANQAAGSDDQTPSAAGAVKPGADSAPPSDKSVDPRAPRPPVDANADARELVKRRMEMCQQRPGICVQEGENREAAGMRPPEGTAKD